MVCACIAANLSPDLISKGLDLDDCFVQLHLPLNQLVPHLGDFLAGS